MSKRIEQPSEPHPSVTVELTLAHPWQQVPEQRVLVQQAPPWALERLELVLAHLNQRGRTQQR
jgi:hypothetical protein